MTCETLRVNPVSHLRLTIVSDVENTDSGGKYVYVCAGGFTIAA